MVDTEAIKNFAFQTWGVVTWIIIAGVCFMVLFYIGRLYYINKKFEYRVRIKKEEPLGSGNVIEVMTDKGGIFLDKVTRNRLFILKANRVGMTPDNIPYYTTEKGIKIVEVLQLGLKSFRYLDKPKIVTNSPVALAYNVQDQDIAFALNVIDTAKLIGKKSTIWQQLAPFIGMAFVFALVVVALYFIFKKFDVLADIAVSLKDTAIEIGKAKTGTVVVGNAG